MSADHLAYPPRPSPNNDNGPPKNVLIFFIPGNPGLIGYYAPFLSALRGLLDATAAALDGIRFHIHGQSLAGFVDEDHEPFSSRCGPYDLDYQIRHILRTVRGLRVVTGSGAGQSQSQSQGQGQREGRGQGELYDHVLLIGHSVGAYIALETCHRVLRDPALAPELKLTSGVLLFPTIDHIADSPSGLRLNMLRQTPLLGAHAHRVAQGFLRLWPYDALYWFVSRALGFPPHAAEVTTRWLKSRDGVWQSLYLGMDEMRVIGEDKWNDELWEIAAATTTSTSTTSPSKPLPPPKFYFFFGRQDHWVADRYRDEFIRKRSAQPERTRLIVDEDGLPHAFCIEHSIPVAEKVHGWITEMFGAAAATMSSSPTTSTTTSTTPLPT